ncbi:lanC-like protein 3 isoform X2 [Cimex lectularius]|uniref:LanC-like protein 3 homolog n=1 Tax=Cimex lectularius TaxID=79782 RepID=A0A8I6SMD6_CIMLE|nr:lanC-like protein 3 isoform X2 [Cimex lectularius]
MWLFYAVSWIVRDKLEDLNRSFRYFSEDIKEMSRKSSRTRFFPNTYLDYQENNAVNVDYKQIRSDILANVYVCAEEQKKVHHGIEGGLYVGTYGNAYTFYHLSKKSRFVHERADLLSAAVELITCGVATCAKSKAKDPSDECAFLLGKAGIYAVGAAVFFEAGKDDFAADCIKEYINVGCIVANESYASFGGDELFVGRAGYLCGALWLNRVFGRPVISQDVLHTICEAIMASGKRYSEEHNSRTLLMYHYYNTEYLGAAHGLCSILQMLLSCDSFLEKHKQAEREIKNTVDFFLKIQEPNGNFPAATDEIGQSRGSDELIHWCHGAPGVVYLLLKAYIRWHEPKYLTAAMKCGEIVWQRGLLKKGPGICHGVAGNGYVFLALYRATNDLRYLHRANQFAKFLKTEEFKKARVPDNPYSLYEGLAGTICFLADLMEPEDAAFPFFEFMPTLVEK